MTNGSLYMIKYLHIFSYMRKSFLIYYFATAPFCIYLKNKIKFSSYISVWIRQGSTLLNLSFDPSAQEPVPGPALREGKPATAHERQQRGRSNPAPWLRRQCLSDSLEKPRPWWLVLRMVATMELYFKQNSYKQVTVMSCIYDKQAVTAFFCYRQMSFWNIIFL
jgi:hypothetical protein